MGVQAVTTQNPTQPALLNVTFSTVFIKKLDRQIILRAKC